MNLQGRTVPDSPEEHQRIHVWRTPHLDNLELLHASYRDHCFPRHFHDEYVLGLMVRGVEALRHRGSTHRASVGSVLLINPGEPHSNFSINRAGFAYRTLYPPVNLLVRFARLITGKETEILLRGPVLRDRRLGTTLLRFHIAVEHGASRLEQQTRFVELLAAILANCRAVPAQPISPRREAAYVKLVREYLEENYARNVSLSELGALTSISPFHLHRMFCREIGVPPHTYQTQLRIICAKRLLRSGKKLTETALEAGFADQSHLARYFKRIVGMTPLQYSSHRKNIQDTPSEHPLP